MWMGALRVTMRFLRTQVGSPRIWSDWKCNGPDWDHNTVKGRWDESFLSDVLLKDSGKHVLKLYTMPNWQT